MNILYILLQPSVRCLSNKVCQREWKPWTNYISGVFWWTRFRQVPPILQAHDHVLITTSWGIGLLPRKSFLPPWPFLWTGALGNKKTQSSFISQVAFAVVASNTRGSCWMVKSLSSCCASSWKQFNTIQGKRRKIDIIIGIKQAETCKKMCRLFIGLLFWDVSIIFPPRKYCKRQEAIKWEVASHRMLTCTLA